ncbi:hypothetical protein [Candidatus Tisiphia endosymbiont of Nemotelus uliginosus]|uniref:hypothetical protein n=1 Tax=Candidatus Tisiphia endosymbiont of Nemotelus uliginosus TaxID=3077926 RepID=UPI0035C88945
MTNKQTIKEIYEKVAKLVDAAKREEALEIIQKDLLLQNNGLILVEQLVEEAFNDKNFKLHVIIAAQYKNALARSIQLSGENIEPLIDSCCQDHW